MTITSGNPTYRSTESGYWDAVVLELSFRCTLSCVPYDLQVMTAGTTDTVANTRIMFRSGQGGLKWQGGSAIGNYDDSNGRTDKEWTLAGEVSGWRSVGNPGVNLVEGVYYSLAYEMVPWDLDEYYFGQSGMRGLFTTNDDNVDSDAVNVDNVTMRIINKSSKPQFSPWSSGGFPFKFLSTQEGVPWESYTVET